MGAPSSGMQLLPVSGFCQAAGTVRSTWGVTGGLFAGVWCLLGDTGSWTVPVVPTVCIPGVRTRVTVPDSDFICNLSFERLLGEPQVRARSALRFSGLTWGLGACLALKTGGFLWGPLAVD